MPDFDLPALDNLSSCVEILRAHGLVRIKDYAPHEAVQALIQEYAIRRGDKTGTVTIQIQEDAAQGVSAVHRLFPFSLMQELAARYFDQEYYFTNKADFILSTTNTESKEMYLHFGVVRKLRFILYLTAADETNGCFHCQIGSHQQTQRLLNFQRKLQLIPTHEDTKRICLQHNTSVVPITGTAGTLLIFDTDLFHRAGKVFSGERLIIRSECIVALKKSPLYRALRYARARYRQWGASP